MNLDKYVTTPKNLYNSSRSLRDDIALTAPTFKGSRFTPSALNTWPEKLTSDTRKALIFIELEIPFTTTV